MVTYQYSRFPNELLFYCLEGVALTMIIRPAKKGTKEGVIGEALRKCALPYVPHPPHRHPMPENVPIFGHLHKANLKFLKCKRSKIGTFLNAGWRCGGGFQRGRIFVAPLWLTSFGPFLVQRQEKDITALRVSQKGIPFCNIKSSAEAELFR